jgi:hypothetical protein
MDEKSEEKKPKRKQKTRSVDIGKCVIHESFEETRCSEYEICPFYLQCLDYADKHRWAGWTTNWEHSKEGKKKFWPNLNPKKILLVRLKLPKLINLILKGKYGKVNERNDQRRNGKFY